jgi:hypothetical protein
MAAIVLCAVCLIIFLITRWGSNTFGTGAGTLMGFSFVGCLMLVPLLLIGVMIVMALATLLPVTLPFIVPIAIGVALIRFLNKPVHK